MGQRPRNLLHTVVGCLFKVRTMHDMRRILRAGQLVLTFGLLIVLPVMLLAYFALASTQGASQSLDAMLTPRTSPILLQVHEQEREIFADFEARVTGRAQRGQSAVHNIQELSPYLRAAYQLDAGGRLLRPFLPPPDLPELGPVEQEPLEYTPEYVESWHEGLNAEAAGQHVLAAAHFKAAEESVSNQRLRGQARLAYARVLTKTGQGENVYSDIISDYGAVRDPRNFLIGDLARLAQGELAAQGADPDVRANAMMEFAKYLLDDGRWTIWEPQRPSIVRRLLTKLEQFEGTGSVSPDWMASAWARFRQRDQQLFQTGVLVREMKAVHDDTTVQAGSGFEYVDGPQALWAVRATGNGTLLYAFDIDAIIGDLDGTVRRLAEVDPDLVAAVTVSSVSDNDEGVYVQPLTFVEGHVVRVAAADADALAAQRRSRLNTQIAVILLAIGTSVVGVVVTVRFVGRELQAARMKTDFAANVSHELRSPITQIRLKGESLMLDLVFDDDDRQQHYEAIVRESERLSRLVDNVLDFAAIESGTKRYTFRAEDMERVIYNTVDTARAALDQAGFDVEVDVPPDLPVVWMDREAISQVLTNLVSNAVKYGSDGRWLGVSARVIKDRRRGACVRPWHGHQQGRPEAGLREFLPLDRP